MQAVLEGLQVNVRRPHVGHPADQDVDQANDRRFTGQIAQMLDEITGDRCVRVALWLGVVLGLRLKRLCKRRIDFRFEPDRREHRMSGGQTQCAHREVVLRRGHHDLQPVLGQIQGKNVIGAEELRRNSFNQRQFRGERISEHQRHFHLPRQHTRHIQFGHQAQTHQYAAEQTARLALRRQRLLKIPRRKLVLRNQHVAEQWSCRRVRLSCNGVGADRVDDSVRFRHHCS